MPPKIVFSHFFPKQDVSSNSGTLSHWQQAAGGIYMLRHKTFWQTDLRFACPHTPPKKQIQMSTNIATVVVPCHCCLGYKDQPTPTHSGPGVEIHQWFHHSPRFLQPVPGPPSAHWSSPQLARASALGHFLGPSLDLEIHQLPTPKKKNGKRHHPGHPRRNSVDIVRLPRSSSGKYGLQPGDEGS